jgi:hypothetical protein
MKSEDMWREWERRGSRVGWKGNTEGKRPLRRPRCRWIDNIKINHVELRWGDVGWIDLLRIGTCVELL